MIRQTSQSFTREDFDAELCGRGTPWRNVLTVALPVATVIFALTWLLSRSLLIAADRKSTRLNSSHVSEFRMPSSA